MTGAFACQEGAYAVILSPDRRVLLIQANGGRLYLPGGRLEASESPEAALVREVEEECGWWSRPLVRLGARRQPVSSGGPHILAYYYLAELDLRVGRGDYLSLWLPAEAAARLVHRSGDAWAIAEALARAAAPAQSPRPSVTEDAAVQAAL